MSRAMGILAVLWLLPVAVHAADEAEYLLKLRSQLGQKQFAEADATYAEALKEYPDSPGLKQLRMPLYLGNKQAQRFESAAGHISQYTGGLVEMASRNPAVAQILPQLLDEMVSAYLEAKQAPQAEATLDEFAQRLEKNVNGAVPPELSGLATEIRGRKLILLAQTKRAPEAEAQLKKDLEAAQEKLTEAPDDATAILKLAAILNVQARLTALTTPAQAAAAQKQYEDFLTEKTMANRQSPVIVTVYLMHQQRKLQEEARANPQAAGERLADLREFLDGLNPSDPSLAARIRSAEGSLKSVERVIETGMKHFKLIGQPAVALDAEAWVNGDPLTDADLKGKVVLLDFWAVWCGPCIATFPHLREWQDKYGEKGLVIIGATRYYSFGWDSDAKRPMQVENLAPEEEQTAMKAFADHHQLKHRLAVMPRASDFASKYGVTGIPQAVLIDQQGIIRLIRVGSGETNAHDIEALIQQLLATKKE